MLPVGQRRECVRGLGSEHRISRPAAQGIPCLDRTLGTTFVTQHQKRWIQGVEKAKRLGNHKDCLEEQMQALIGKYEITGD